MSDFSDYYENKIGEVLRGTSLTAPATIYVALFSADTGLEVNNPTAEIAGLGYARQVITLSAFSGGVSSNNAEISFPAAGENWLEATHYAIVDHVSNTNWGTNVNVLMWHSLVTPKTCAKDDQVVFKAEKLTATIR